MTEGLPSYNLEIKKQLLTRLELELESTRRRELYLGNYVVDLTCEIRALENNQQEVES